MRIVVAVLRGCLYASISGLLIGILAFALDLPIEKAISLSAPIGMVAGFAGLTLGWSAAAARALVAGRVIRADT